MVCARVTLREHVPLAPYTTLGVGGPARWFVEAADEAAVREALGWARARGVPLRVLGGGSNVVVADAGVEGLVVRLVTRGVEAREAGGGGGLTAAAGGAGGGGERWDALVARAVAHGWAGIECLSGIPGLVGATPIQNVGAYGQEVSDTIRAVRVLDTRDGSVATLDPAACGFGYRDSRFRSGEPGRFVVLAGTDRLRPGGAPTVAYADVARALQARGLGTPSLGDVRESVLALRRAKSMVLDPADPNRRSCGSFFTNPVVSAAEAARVAAAAGDPAMPRWPAPGGGGKLSAAGRLGGGGLGR